MTTTWNHIKAWLYAHAPQIAHELSSGANTSDFEDLEQLVGLSLPDEVKLFYQIHNGQQPDSDGLIDSEELLSTTRMAKEWSIWKKLYDKGRFNEKSVQADEEIQDVWWHPAWIPITYNGSGDHYCIDLAPSETGMQGQIIRLLHDSPRRRLVASSFTVWMQQFAIDLESGLYTYSQESWGIKRISN